MSYKPKWLLKFSSLSVALLILAGCNSVIEPGGKMITGELYIKLISLGSLYGTTSGEKERYYGLTDSLRSLGSDCSKDDYKLLEYYDLLENLSLIESPFFHMYVRGKMHSPATVFVRSEDYEKIVGYDRDFLSQNKLRIVLRGDKHFLKSSRIQIIDCSEILSIHVINESTVMVK